MINNDAEIVASTNLFTEFELTDKQLESISGGFDHDDHRGFDHDDHRGFDRDDRGWHRQGYPNWSHHWH